jgi:hypothetical protein
MSVPLPALTRPAVMLAAPVMVIEPACEVIAVASTDTVATPVTLIPLP